MITFSIWFVSDNAHVVILLSVVTLSLSLFTQCLRLLAVQKLSNEPEQSTEIELCTWTQRELAPC